MEGFRTHDSTTNDTTKNSKWQYEGVHTCIFFLCQNIELTELPLSDRGVRNSFLALIGNIKQWQMKQIATLPPLVAEATFVACTWAKKAACNQRWYILCCRYARGFCGIGRTFCYFVISTPWLLFVCIFALTLVLGIGYRDPGSTVHHAYSDLSFLIIRSLDCAPLIKFILDWGGLDDTCINLVWIQLVCILEQILE